MRWLTLPAGVLVLIFTLLDVFRTLVMPRAARGRYRLSRLVFIGLWRPWRWIALRARTEQGRERLLAGASPMSLFLLLSVWAALCLLGYGLLLWSPAFVHGIHGASSGGFGTALYFSGTSLFTIGFGDVVATGATRTVVILEGATGLGLIAVVISYLPVLYQAFNRREVGVLLLDARAGAPPSGPELLRRAGGQGVRHSLPRLFREWERWAADILETHLTYPFLAFFRSPHDNTSWVTSLGAVLDAATLVLSCVDDEGACADAARMLYATGTHAVEDLFFYFRLPEREGSIERAEFDHVFADLGAVGIPLRGIDESWKVFSEMRAAYGARLNALALRIAAPPAQWLGDRSTLPRPAGGRTFD
ncbi:MAG: potassium channel family protein [Actinomycetota bacterium]|nr:potassium channel family protein [Actinomycetota bacterium]